MITIPHDTTTTRTPDPCPSCSTQVDPVTVEVCPKCKYVYPEEKVEPWNIVDSLIVIGIILGVIGFVIIFGWLNDLKDRSLVQYFTVEHINWFKSKRIY